MVFGSRRRNYNEDHMNFGHRSPMEPVPPRFEKQFLNSNFVADMKWFDDTRGYGYENTLSNLRRERYEREHGYTRDDVLDEDLSLLYGSGGMFDTASSITFDKRMEDLKERDNMFCRYENIMGYRRKRQLEDIIMREKNMRSRLNFNSQEQKENGCSRLYCPGGAVLVKPNGDIHVSPPGQMVPIIDVRGPSGYSSPLRDFQSQSVRDQTLKRQWCTGRKPAGYHVTPNMHSRRNPSAHRSDVDKHFKWKSAMDCQLPNRLVDDELTPLVNRVLIKVRNVHPTACLHELHVQKRELFPNKPTFDTTRFYSGTRKKGNFAVVCNFEINGAKLYTYHREQTKSDAKMNAARNMLRKLKAIPNLNIILDVEKTNSGVFASFEHPRCQLLHLHDTNPEIYPMSPTFQSSLLWTRPRSHSKTRCINMTCHFQVGREKLTTIGAASNKKQAIVQAARNMLKRLFPTVEIMKDSEIGSEQAALDRMNTPWTCHFCKIFMTGRKPFLAHLTGRSHVQRMSELELNAEEENKILQAKAEEAYMKTQEERRSPALESSVKRESPAAQSVKNEVLLDHNNVMNTSSNDSQESEVTSKNTSSSSEKSEFESSYYLSSSGDMKATE
jgi:hypothetical protein